MKNVAPLLFALGCLCVFDGCTRHQARPGITAIGLSPANRGEPAGIPYYLPKPLLVVAKNVRHIDESKVGLSQPAPIPGGFDNQASYADIKANVTVPGTDKRGDDAAQAGNAKVADANLVKATLAKSLEPSFVAETMTPGDKTTSDGVQPDSFYTYQIVFVPDLTQKYGLRITGGAGEIRAAMNMVNGWMYTGMGPYYMKDSSSAQNAMATGAAAMYAGRGVSSVLDSVGNLATTISKAATGRENSLSSAEVRELNEQINLLQTLSASTPKIPQSMLNYAEIYIYEPVAQGGDTQWHLVAEHHFDRAYLADADTAEGRKARQEMFNILINKAASGSVPSPPSTKPPVPPTPPVPTPAGTVPSSTAPPNTLPAGALPRGALPVPVVPPVPPARPTSPTDVQPDRQSPDSTSRRTPGGPANPTRDTGGLEFANPAG